MLVSAEKMLQEAFKGGYAVGQFNINNLEWTKAILLTSEEENHQLYLEYPKVLQSIWEDIIL